MRAGDSDIRDRRSDQNELNESGVHEFQNHNFNIGQDEATRVITNLAEANLSTLAEIVKTHYTP